MPGRPFPGTIYRRGKDVDPRAFTAEYELEPLPCWRHLPAEEYRRRVAEMVHDIEVETARRIFLTGKVPLGAEEIRKQHPHQQANRPKTSQRAGSAVCRSRCWSSVIRLLTTAIAR